MGIYPQFDRSRLIIKPLQERIHDLTHQRLLQLHEAPSGLTEQALTDLQLLGQRLVEARARGS